MEVLKSTLVRVELPNRHQMVAHVAGKERSKLVRLLPGDKVTVEISLYDLSKGRISAGQSI